MVKCLYVSLPHPLSLTTPPCPTHSPHNSSLLHPLSLTTPPCSTHSPHNSSMLHPLSLTIPPCSTHSPSQLLHAPPTLPHNSSMLHPLPSQLLHAPPTLPHNSSMLHPLPHRLNEQTCESLAGARDEVAALKAVVSQMTEAAAVLHSQLDATKVSVCGVCGALLCMFINIMSHQCAQNVCIFEVEWLCCGCILLQRKATRHIDVILFFSDDCKV